MPNPFTDESRDERFSLNIRGFCDKLRTPESLHRLPMFTKPAHMGVGDFCLKSMLDQHLIDLILKGYYRTVYATLGTLFEEQVTDGTEGDKRHPDR